MKKAERIAAIELRCITRDLQYIELLSRQTKQLPTLEVYDKQQNDINKCRILHVLYVTPGMQHVLYERDRCRYISEYHDEHFTVLCAETPLWIRRLRAKLHSIDWFFRRWLACTVVRDQQAMCRLKGRTYVAGIGSNWKLHCYQKPPILLLK